MLSKWFPNRRTLMIRGAAALFLAGYAVFLFFFSRVEKTPLAGTVGRTFARASVVEVVQDNLQEDGRRYGNQTVTLRILDGRYRGKVLKATSFAGYRMGTVCRKGLQVVALISKSGSTFVTTVYSPDREVPVYVFAGFFLLLLWLVGGKKGLRSAAALLFTFFSLLFLYLPLIYRGYSPFASAVAVGVFTSVVGLCMIGGFTVKTISGIAGTAAGLLGAGAFAALFGQIAGISGYNVYDIDNLIYIGENTRVGIGGLLFAGILFSSLGAVMDVAYSIASAVDEVAGQNAELSREELYHSGVRVGRDMIGTMCNTLILAFAGGSLSVIVTQYAYNYPYLEVANALDTGIEVMQSLSGSLGILISVPVVAFVSARLILFMRAHRQKRTAAGAPEASPAPARVSCRK